ncbi:tetraspanin-8-like isoform X1 [Engraulis encrasicolus]|uniref:tetraspanin-8-like isoform X1 n=1 Tax=Engraulis encrasicolus TaxID=184585 RepID=UPI002FD3F94F
MSCLYIRESLNCNHCTSTLHCCKMAKGSSVLRNIFAFFNLLFALAGVAVIILAIVLHVQISNVQEFENLSGVVVLYVIGFITLAISFLGAYGGFRQVKWMLVTFLVLMCIGFLIMLRLSVVLAIGQNKVGDYMQEGLSRPGLLPLDKTSDDLQEFMNTIQQNYHCCGLFKGYEDWGEHVPSSCDCTSEEDPTPNDVCVAMPKNIYETLLLQRERSNRMVYSQACGPLGVALIMKVYVVVMGIFFGLTALTGLAVVLSSILIAQINRSRASGAVTGVVLPPTLMFSTPGQMKYNQLVNEPYH